MSMYFRHSPLEVLSDNVESVTRPHVGDWVGTLVSWAEEWMFRAGRALVVRDGCEGLKGMAEDIKPVGEGWKDL